MMQHLRSRSYAAVCLAYGLWLKWSTLSPIPRHLLLAALLVMLVGLMFLLSLYHLVMLPTSVSHPKLAGPGCGAGCILPS